MTQHADPDTRVHDHVHAHDHVRDQDHGHGHGQDDRHGHGLENYHVHGGAPVLDIGGDIGALVVTMDREALGTELHLRSEHEPARSVHTGVWERDHGSQRVVTAVFVELVEGAYQVLDSVGAAVRRVEIEGGRLTTIDLRR